MSLQRYEGNWAKCLELPENLENMKSLADGRAVITDRINRYKVNPKDTEHVNKGTWLAENTNVVNEQILMARGQFNPLIQYAEQATQAHASGNEFFLTKNILLKGKLATKVLTEIAKADKGKLLQKRRVFTPSQNTTYDVSWDRFGDDDTIVWHAQNQKLAKEYGKFINDNFNISSVKVYLPVTNLGDIARGNWLFGLGRGDRPDFNCDSRILDDDYGSVFRIVLATRIIIKKNGRII